MSRPALSYRAGAWWGGLPSLGRVAVVLAAGAAVIVAWRYTPESPPSVIAPAAPLAQAPAAALTLAAPRAPALLAEIQRMRSLSPNDFCGKEARKLKGKADPLPQPWGDALAEVGDFYGTTAWREAIQAGSARIGMSQCAAMAAWGQPQKANTSTFAWGTKQQWVYGNGRYLYFKDDQLESIQD